MSYSDITFQDPNRIKRWLQNQRLTSALRLGVSKYEPPLVICDFGAGNGELCKHLAKLHPKAKIICYEPTKYLLDEARKNLSATTNVEFCKDISNVAKDSIDLVFCLEVFEHLPPNETQEALTVIHAILKPTGKFIIGVPVEIGIPALYKGLFRMFRRYGAFDANIKNVLLSFLGYPPTKRPAREIAPEYNYFFEHLGFDFRNLKKSISHHFENIQLTASPFPMLGPWLMPEIYFSMVKARRMR